MIVDVVLVSGTTTRLLVFIIQISRLAAAWFAIFCVRLKKSGHDENEALLKYVRLLHVVLHASDSLLEYVGGVCQEIRYQLVLFLVVRKAFR